jgi:hypothetical protein
MFLFGTAVFEVTRVWKGDVGQRFDVEWRRGDGGDCNGFWTDQLKIGAELIVFAKRGKDGVFRTNLCSPTGPVSNAATVIKELGAGRVPTAR